MSMPRRVAVVGLGLIGGSVARSLRERTDAPHIVGFDADPEATRYALEAGWIDSVAATVAEAARGAGVLMVATPVRGIAPLVRIALEADPDVVVTDAGSVKQAVMEGLAGVGDAVARFVPGHPVAGSERFGVTAAEPALFRGRRVILTPTDATAAPAVARVRALWEATGAHVECMTPAHHDEVLAATSHLPHVLAFALVDCLAGMEDRRELFAYAAGGFRDFTRIASSSPEMWRDILLENRRALDDTLGAFERTLGALRASLREGDEPAVLETLTRARAARQRFLSLMEAPLPDPDTGD